MADQKRIALCGSAGSSMRLAPYRDPSWAIWACSPGSFAQMSFERADAFFELHRWEPPVIGRPDQQVPWFSPEYTQWLRDFKGTVWMTEVVPEVKNSARIPREHLMDKYGPYFFTSSLSWMFAMALEVPGVEEIGLWGVDMSATEEYGYQRPGCHYFITLAMQRGIKVTIPPESDLLQPHPIYGIGEWNPMMVKMTARMKELTTREAQAAAVAANANNELLFLRGAIDDLKYVINTWTGSVEIDLMMERAAARREKPTADVIQIKGASD